MKKGEVYQGTIEKVLFPNKGYVTVDDANVDAAARVIVKNGIPGQKIEYRVLKKKHGQWEGMLLRVLEPSPQETEAPGCSIFPQCGGCMYRTMSYETQLEMKQTQIEHMMRHALSSCYADGEPDYRFEGVTPSPVAAGYRNKMEYAFGDSEKDGPLMLGLHKKASTYDILPAVDCQIVHNDFNLIVQCVLEFCRARGWSYYHKMSHEGYLRHLLVRRASMTGEILVDLVTSSQYGDIAKTAEDSVDGKIADYADSSENGAVEEAAAAAREAEAEMEAMKALADELQKLPLEGELIGVLHTVNDSVADMIRNDRTDILCGRDYFYEELLGLRFKITPFSFFQTNSKGAEVLYNTAREFLGDVDQKTVFDLYSGTGTIAQMLAPVAGEVVGVEIVEEAVEAAKVNAELNGLTNCKFLAGDVLKVIDEIEEKPDVIVLDPPRDGIHPKALPKIIDYGVDRIVYISCKPSSLARDLPAFLANGYRIDRMKCVDMFPHTVHVETVVLMSKVNPNK